MGGEVQGREEPRRWQGAHHPDCMREAALCGTWGTSHSPCQFLSVVTAKHVLPYQKCLVLSINSTLERSMGAEYGAT